jgi:hypothetical protein
MRRNKISPLAWLAIVAATSLAYCCIVFAVIIFKPKLPIPTAPDMVIENGVVEDRHAKIIWSDTTMAEVCVDGYVFIISKRTGIVQLIDVSKKPVTCFELMEEAG